MSKRFAVSCDGHEYHLPRYESWNEADGVRASLAAGTVQFAAQGTSEWRTWDYSTTPPTDVTTGLPRPAHYEPETRPNHLPKTGEYTNAETEAVAKRFMDRVIDMLEDQADAPVSEPGFRDAIEDYVRGWVIDVEDEARSAYGDAGSAVMKLAYMALGKVDWTNLANQFYETYRDVREAAEA